MLLASDFGMLIPLLFACAVAPLFLFVIALGISRIAARNGSVILAVVATTVHVLPLAFSVIYFWDGVVMWTGALLKDSSFFIALLMVVLVYVTMSVAVFVNVVQAIRR